MKHSIQQSVTEFENKVKEECDRQCNTIILKIVALAEDYMNSKVVPVLKKELDDILASIKPTDNDEMFEKIHISISDLKTCEVMLQRYSDEKKNAQWTENNTLEYNQWHQKFEDIQSRYIKIHELVQQQINGEMKNYKRELKELT
jgi:hypothetical protein